jgi:dTDP-glucose 4,6-dehydratase
LHVADHAGAIGHVLERGASGQIYNVPGNNERANRDVVTALLAQLGKPWSLVRQVQDRPGHDRRYAMDDSKLVALGWTNKVSFEDGLAATIAWYRDNQDWWRSIKSGEWDAYYRRQYGARLAGSTEAR